MEYRRWLYSKKYLTFNQQLSSPFFFNHYLENSNCSLIIYYQPTLPAMNLPCKILGRAKFGDSRLSHRPSHGTVHCQPG